MKIISWNPNARSDNAMLSSQCACLFQSSFDLITLQENEPLASHHIRDSEYASLPQEQIVA